MSSSAETPSNAQRSTTVDRDAVLPDEPAQAPSDSSGCREQVVAQHAEKSRWDPLANAPTELRVHDSVVGRLSFQGHRERLPSRPSEGGHWYSGHFPEDEQETDLARMTDFGEPPPEPMLADRAVLLRMEGVEAGRVYSLGLELAKLGRHPDNQLVIDDAGISRFHAEVLWEHGTHVVRDCGSRNGTFVSGQRIEVSELHNGDLLQLGPKVGLRYSVVDDRQETLLRRMYDSSNRDALTGAYNRKHYVDRLASEIAYAERHRADVSIIMLDIDHFKQVNDSYGHAAGDTILKQVAGTVLRQLRTEDVFARVGGEEFVVILRGIPLLGAARLAERLRATVAALPTTYGRRVIPITVSLGCASLSELKQADGQELAVLADMRLYAAKQGGRNRVVAKGRG